MILDSSALIAVILDEPDGTELLTAMLAQRCRISAGTLIEVGIVADQRSEKMGHQLDRLLSALDVTVEPVTARHAELARLAHRRYGRGSGSPARLNFGDCLSYALAVDTGEGLLFKGDDFGHTDVPRVAR